ncbi:MAG: hypothetical protein IPM91_13095 [Bacteroidetes bacterium]|nr:hypothetical protein [Bacteroidota bacterium]
MKKLALICLLAIMVLGKNLFAQYHDANWVVSTGYDSINNNTLIYFPPGIQTPQTSLTNGFIPFGYANANISDQHGFIVLLRMGSMFITVNINHFRGYSSTLVYFAPGLNRLIRYFFLAR